MEDKYIVSRKHKETGQKFILDEPRSLDAAQSLSNKLRGPNLEITIKELSTQELERRKKKEIKARFINFMLSNDYDDLEEAIFNTKDEKLWPFDLMDIEEANNIEDSELPLWIWRQFTPQQINHISCLLKCESTNLW